MDFPVRRIFFLIAGVLSVLGTAVVLAFAGDQDSGRTQPVAYTSDISSFAAAVREAVEARSENPNHEIFLPEPLETSGRGPLATPPDSMPPSDLLFHMSRLYRYQADVLAAQAVGDFGRTETLILRAIEDLAVLVRQPGITAQPRFRELFRTLVTEYEAHFGIPADTLVISRGEIVDLQDELFLALNDVDEPLLEDVQLPSIRPATTAVPMTVNRLVQRSIDYLVGTQEKHLLRWMSRSETYFGMIEKILAEEGVPDEVKYLAMIESGLNPKARSWAQAVGMWQFMAGTANDYGLHVNSWLDERMDPEKSTRAAARYLKNLHTMFGDWHLAMAAYNCGPGRVKQAIARHRSRSSEPVTFWSIYEYLPRETRNYVPMYIAASLIASNASEFRLQKVDPGTAYAYEIVDLKGAHTLEDIARLAGTDAGTIRALNPELRRPSTPPGSTPYTLRIPYGSYERFAAAYRNAPDDDRRTAVHHVVRYGDSLSEIAVRYGTTVRDVMAANGLDNAIIHAGQRLVLPVEGARSPDAGMVNGPPQRVRYGRPTLAPVARIDAEMPLIADAAPAQQSKIVVRVKRGENLSSLAQRYGVSVGNIRRWNDLSGKTIYPGQKLAIHR